MRPGHVVFPEVGLTDSATLVIEGMIVLILYEPVIVFVIRFCNGCCWRWIDVGITSAANELEEREESKTSIVRLFSYSLKKIYNKESNSH